MFLHDVLVAVPVVIAKAPYLRRDGNENVTNFAYLMSKSNSFARSVRAFLVFVHFFHVFGKSATWNDQFVVDSVPHLLIQFLESYTSF